MLERTYVKETVEKIGSEVKLQGWAESIRLMGKIAFIELRDKTATVQCVCYMPDFETLDGNSVKETTIESVIEVEGVVKARPDNQINQNSQTGTVEVEVRNFKLLNRAEGLPIPVAGDGYDINEESRLKYRYLDIRRKRVQRILRMRSKFVDALRQEFLQKDYVEIETPILTSSTKEGARDFVVPSRMNPGKFYALPQSPQQYKQLLMTAGVENYFQVARCIRDENLRADRGFEFTQFDIEMSFVNRDKVMAEVEKSIKNAVKSVGGILKNEEFPVLTYKDAMENYGADKFDMRNDEEKRKGVLAFAWVVDFPFFKRVDRTDKAELVDGKSGWTFTHNPFSIPKDEYLTDHLEGRNVESILTTQYDLVCNGYEVGGGSIRAHKANILKSTYKIMGYKDEEIESSVGHMIKAFELGTPPHGGIALGIDRLVMLLANENSLKETIAFPMTYNGHTAVMEGPSEITKEQLEELKIKIEE